MNKYLLLVTILWCNVQVSFCGMLSASEISVYFENFKNDSARNELNQLITKQEERKEKLTRLSQVLKETTQGIHDPSFDINHPLNAFRFIRNNSIVYEEIIEELSLEMKLYAEVHAQLEKQIKDIKTFENEELALIIRGLIDIKRTYNITISDMANGNFGSFKTAPLTAAECGDIVIEVATFSKDLSYAETWLEECLKKVDNNDSTTTATKLLTKAAVAYYNLGGYKEAVSRYSLVAYINQNSRYHKNRLKYYIKEFMRHKNDKPLSSVLKQGDLWKSFQSTCQGNIPRIVNVAHNTLVCDRVDNGHPLLIIQPIKREIISKEPLLVVFHDVISKTRMMSLRQVGFPHLKRSKVMAKSSRVDDPNRTSKSVFIDYKNKDAMFLNNVIEAVTSLRAKAYEKVQVANYGVGGYYYCHHDYFPANFYDNDFFDNRIATFMLYMSNVENGGGTAFPEIPEVVFPEMGSAVFWYNLHPNNTVNVDTMHCACPPVFGDKWVANVWIRRNNNEFTAPCPLDQYKTSWW